MLLNLIGAVATGDPLFLLSQLSGGAGNYKELGFFHLWNMFVPSVGTITTLLFLIGIIGFVVADEGMKSYLKKYEIVYIGFLPVFLFWCLVTAPQFTLIKLGANLRQIASLTPAIVLFAGMGMDLMRKKDPSEHHFFAIGITAILGFLILSFFSFDYNHFIYTSEPDYTKIIVLVLAAGLLFVLPKLGISYKYIGMGLGILGALHTLYVEDAIPLAKEDATVKEMSDFVIKNQLTNREKVVSTHTMFNYYNGSNAWERQDKYIRIPNLSEIETLPKGAIIVWDSHYSKRWSEVDISYFQNNPKYKLLHQKLTDDQRFYAAVFEKL